MFDKSMTSKAIAARVIEMQRAAGIGKSLVNPYGSGASFITLSGWMALLAVLSLVTVGVTTIVFGYRRWAILNIVTACPYTKIRPNIYKLYKLIGGITRGFDPSISTFSNIKSFLLLSLDMIPFFKLMKFWICHPFIQDKFFDPMSMRVIFIFYQ